MKNIVSKDLLGLIFKSKTSDDKVIVCGVVIYALCKDSISHSQSSKDWAKEHNDNFLEVRFKSIIDDSDKSMPLELFLQYYELLTQKFDETKWIN